MKQILCLLCILIAFRAQSQTKPDSLQIRDSVKQAVQMAMTTKVFMDIDTSVFNSSEQNAYGSEKYGAFIMSLVAPQSFESAEEDLKRPIDKPGLTQVVKGKLTGTKMPVVFMKAIVVKDGKNMCLHTYAIKASATQTIFLNAVFPEKDRALIEPIVEKAARTARLQ